MSFVELGDVRVEVDPERTRAAYAAIAARSADACECAYCRNFRALGLAAFPDPVLAFFHDAGIDVTRPAEAYQYNQTATGNHLYGGEYCFFGRAPLADGAGLDPSAPFDFTFTKPSPLAQDAFRAQGAVCFSFMVEVPWVIEEAP